MTPLKQRAESSQSTLHMAEPKSTALVCSFKHHHSISNGGLWQQTAVSVAILEMREATAAFYKEHKRLQSHLRQLQGIEKIQSKCHLREETWFGLIIKLIATLQGHSQVQSQLHQDRSSLVSDQIHTLTLWVQYSTQLSASLVNKSLHAVFPRRSHKPSQ